MPASTYKVKRYMPCDMCGTRTNRRRRNTRKPVCLECSINCRVSQMIQMHERSGPYWDAWLESTIRALQGMDRGGMG